MSLILQEFIGAPAETAGSLEKKHPSVSLKFHKTKDGMLRVVNGSSYSEQQLLKKTAEDNEGPWKHRR